MTTTYSAFYLPTEKKQELKYNPKIVQEFTGLFDQATYNTDVKTMNNLSAIAKNMNIQGGALLYQKYAANAVMRILQGKSIPSKMMMDSLFNQYAPALNLTWAKAGYNSLNEMKDAIFHGTANATNFVQGFANGLESIQKTMYSVDYSKYGEEIPIDVLTKCDYNYSRDVATHPVATGEAKLNKVTRIHRVKITLNGHVKNENAEFWNINDFNNKIVNAIQNMKPITFRVGKDIYEDVIIETYKPTITNLDNIKFESTLYYDYPNDITSSVMKDGNRIPNLKPELRIIPSPRYAGTTVPTYVPDDKAL